MLTGKNAIITGARRGIGRETVECFAGYNANIWACARKPDEAFEADMAMLASKYGVWIKPVYFDLADENAVKAGMKEILSNKLSVDILVNNAGVLQRALLSMLSLDVMREVFEINYFSQMAMIQAVTRVMIRQRKGSIINVSSVEGFLGNAGNCAYGASKAALALATKSIANEVAGSNIRVNAVAPGLTETWMAEQIEDGPRERRLRDCAMHRLGEPREIAEVIAFLASDRASFITGQTLRVDGGL